MIGIALLLVAGIHLGLPTQTPQGAGEFAAIRSRIADMVARGEAPSIAVAVARHGRIIWEEAFGLADVAHKIPATPHTIYQIGSLSKSVMATGLMTLVEHGRASFEDPVNRLIAPARLTAYMGNAADIKVKHILNMTAGIAHGSVSAYDWSDVPQTDSQKDAYIRDIPISVFPPGEVYEYSNYSLGIAELIIERVTRRPIAQYMREEVFGPLGMSHTAVRLDPALERFAAVGYASPNVPIRSRYLIPPGGLGFLSSAHDLAMFGMFHLEDHRPDQRPILRDGSLDRMHSYDAGPQGKHFALGWFNLGSSLVSDGQVGGGNSNLTLLPAEDVAIVVLTNITSRGAQAIAGRVAGDIAGLIRPALAQEQGSALHQYRQRLATPYRPTPELLGTWQGAIKASGGDVPVTLSFAATGGVEVQLRGQAATPMQDVSFNTLHELRGEFTGGIPTVAGQAEPGSMMLIAARVKDGRMYGYVSVTFSTDRGSFTLPQFISLERAASVQGLSPLPPGTVIVPTRYDGDRFYATPVLPRGDTVVVFLDTGGGTLVWDPFVRWLGLTVDTVLNARGAKIAVASFPTFRAERSVPPPAVTPYGAPRLSIRPVPPDGFAAWISRTTQAQLGTVWFADRVWTFDYPGHRLLLHAGTPPATGPASHQIPLSFRTDSAGKHIDHRPFVDLVIAGDSVSMIFDTGATIWLGDDALTRLGDGRPSERPTCHVEAWLFTQWRLQHPDWPVVEHADLLTGAAIIRVPTVSIAGFDVGPVWFSALGGPTTHEVAADAPAFLRRAGGTVGGSLLRHFVVTVDYPLGLATFSKP